MPVHIPVVSLESNRAAYCSKDIVLDLSCGHVIEPRCSQAQRPECVVCHEKGKRTISDCSHILTLPCCSDTTAKQFDCQATCGMIQPCGHNCGCACSDCNTRVDSRTIKRNHGSCKKTCGRPYGTCRHECKEECHGDIPGPPYPAPSDTRCSHSKCSRPCNEPCSPPPSPKNYYPRVRRQHQLPRHRL